MSKSARVTKRRHETALLQKDDSLLRASVIMACLVKRLGAVMANGSGYRVFVTDEEFEAMDGRLEVRRAEEGAGIILHLHPAKVAEPEVEEKG